MMSKSKNNWLVICLLFCLILLTESALWAGSASLLWEAPTMNVDETPLTDLSGFKIYYGTTSGSYSDYIDVGNVTSFEVNDLTDGMTYYFAVTAYDTLGNESGYSGEVSKMPAVNNPPVAVSGGPYTGIEGETLTLNASASSDPDGIIARYEWDINDDGIYDYSSSSPIGNHIYAQQGIYTVKLRVTDNLGKTDVEITTATVSDTSPATGFTGSSASGTAPLTVNFTSTSSGYDLPLTFAWDFDNNGTTDSTVQDPSYIYDSEGTYSVKLTVTDADGSSINFTRTNYVTVTAPVRLLTVNAGSGGTVISSPSGIQCPGTCSDQYLSGTVITLTATPLPGYQFDNWAGCSNPSDNECMLSLSADATVTANFRSDNKSLWCNEGGIIECIERVDGGSDGNNLVNKMPKLNLEYKFSVTLTDVSGSSPRYARLFMTQRSNPAAGDFYYYDLICSGDYATGASCTYTTKLGPAAVHKFYFETGMSDGTTLRYPAEGYITGPATQLLSGYNLVGLPRDIGMSGLTGNAAFGSSLAYRWNAEAEYYTAITASEPVRTGEGYYIYKQANSLSELAAYAEIQDETFTYALRHGWNIISNPYSGNVALSDVKVRKGDDTSLTWTQAASNGWLSNAIYYLNGKDWGNTYGFESAPSAAIVPWVGYWIHLNATDDIYYVVITRPNK